MAEPKKQRHSLLHTLKTSFRDFSDDQCPMMAAALAYYAVFSLPPLLILIVWLVSFLWDPSVVQGEVASQARNFLGQTGADQLNTMMDQETIRGQNWLAKIGGIIVLIFGATGVFVQLQAALNQAWEVEPDPNQGGVMNFILRRLLSLGMVLSIAFLLLISLLVSAAISTLGNAASSWLPMSDMALRALNLGASLLIVALLFAAIYRFMPDAKVSWRDVWFGAFATALLFVLGKWALGAYLGTRDLGSTYGAAGSLAFVLVWIYYSSMILLFGAEMTQAWARRYGDEIEPKEGAVRVVQQRQAVQRGQQHAA
jgi:membrane protein